MRGEFGVFVTGIEKSGKTPLRLLLDAQPWASLGRGRLWSRHHGRFGSLRRDVDLEACVAAITEDSTAEAASILEVVAGGPPEMRTYAGVFGAVARSRAERAGAAVWGEQAAEIETHADELMAAFPGARIIHLIRDPRDRYCESRQSTRTGGLGQAASMWRRSAERATRNRRRFPETYRVVRYEDLVQAPEEVLGSIASDLGQRLSAIDRNSVPAATTVGRFRQALAPMALAYLDSRTKLGRSQWGYPPAALPLTRLEAWWLRLLSGPLNDLRGMPSRVRP